MLRKLDTLSTIPHLSVTKHNHHEEALRNSEEKYRTIFENVSDEIIYLDKHGNIL